MRNKNSKSASSEKLVALRGALRARDLAGFVIPRADEHLGEYVPRSAERLHWISGFSGSAGLAVVLADRAALFTDGRYQLQAGAELDPADWQLLHLIEQPPFAWIAETAGAGARIGYDPWVISEEQLERARLAGLIMVACDPSPIDQLWTDRPAPPVTELVAHPLAFAGQDSASKRAAIAGQLEAAGTDAAIITDPASIAWLLNIRAGDIPYTPVALGFALIRTDGTVSLFLDPTRVPDRLRAGLGARVAGRDRLAAELAAFAGKRVRVDAAGSPAWFAQTLRAAGATVIDGPDPCLLPKACKNEVEQNGARRAHLRDAVPLCRFLAWLAREAPSGSIDEIAAANRLLDLRCELPEFRGESFAAISGAGPNGAIIHYRVSAASNRRLGPDEPYLIDSGAQYPDGTTDVTRTVWIGPGSPPAELRDRYTRVLRGHIAIATLVFPDGIAGSHIDALARAPLWRAGLDYDHGTGHGVGSYLSVHEGPAGISRAARPVKLAPGMILSNEPGFYQPGAYGIRLENLLLVRPGALSSPRRFLCFETLTLAPFDRALIEPALLDAAEIAWLDDYHARVAAAVMPSLAGPDADWLAGACGPIGGAKVA